MFTLNVLLKPFYKRFCLSRTIKTSLLHFHGEYEKLETCIEEETVNLVCVKPDGSKIPIRGKVGDNLLYLCRHHNIELEGACEASLACSTCHVYIKKEFLNLLTTAKEEEEDLLELAAFLKFNSRLGCQIILEKKLDGLEFQLPQATRNFYVDGFVPKPH